MKLKYETGIATLIQFITLSLFGIANAINSIVTACVHHDECVSNAIPSILFFIITAAFFACFWILGYFVQERRSKWLTLLLIVAELVVFRVAYHNAKNHTDLLSLITSISDMILAALVIVLAIRVLRSKGGRIVTKQTQRRRRRHPTTDL